MKTPQQLVESVVSGNAVCEVVSYEGGSDNNRVSFVDDNSAKGKEIVKSHFDAMCKALEEAGLKFDATVNGDYASLNWR